MDKHGHIYASEAETPKEDQERLMAALHDEFKETKGRLEKLGADITHFAETLEPTE